MFQNGEKENVLLKTVNITVPVMVVNVHQRRVCPFLHDVKVFKTVITI